MWKLTPGFSLPHQPKGVQYTRPSVFRSLKDEIAFHRKWGAGAPHLMKGSKFARWSKFAVKMFPQVRAAMAVWELYNIGTYVWDEYQSSITPDVETPGYVRRNWASEDPLMEAYYFG